MDIKNFKETDELVNSFNKQNHLIINPSKYPVDYVEKTIIYLFKLQVGNKYNGKWIEPAAKQIAEHITGNFNKGLKLIGVHGSGKTVMLDILVKMFNVLGRKKFNVITSKDLFLHLTKQIDLNTPIELSTYSFIDDLGAEEAKHYNTFPVVDWMMKKYREDKIIFTTTNLTTEMMDEHYGGRIGSRASEMFDVVKFGNIDFRKL